MRELKLSIIVCTYNRAEILDHCIESFTHVSCPPELFELIVVDNNSSDNTRIIFEKYLDKLQNYRYIKEQTIGLSHARNTGYKEARADWVTYIDDDAKLLPNFVNNVIAVCEQYKFDAFGGKFTAWNYYGTRKWLPENYGSSGNNKSDIEVTDGYITGLNMTFRKSILLEMSGFNVNLGMTGDTVAYGEETELIDRMRSNGYIIGFAPNVVVEHLVGKHKLTLKWHLMSEYAYGRDGVRMWNKNTTSAISLMKTIIKSILLFPLKIFKSVTVKKYYIQNALLDSFKPVFFSIGEYMEYKRSNDQMS